MKCPPALAGLSALFCGAVVGNVAGVGPAIADEDSWRISPEVETLRSRVRGMNVVVVMVDALRAHPFADPVASAKRFPNIAALRRRARWFTNAFAPGAGTDLSMGGILTGKRDALSGAAVTLPEILSARRFVPHAVVPREVVRAIGPTLFSRGLAGYDILVTDPRKANVPAGLNSHRVTIFGLSFIELWLNHTPEESGPFFLWLHYFDVHEHHQLPDDLPEIVAHNGGRVPRTPFEKYEALLAITDAALGRLFAGIARRNLQDNTIVIFAADHGDSLKEDPRLPASHGRVLYNPLVHVPLAIAIPGLEGGDDPRPASLLDLPITLLDLQGLRIPPSMNAGQSLLPALLNIPAVQDQPRTLVLNESDQFAVIRWPFKVLVRRKTEAAELYDLSRDFAESLNLAPKMPEVVQSLSDAYRAIPAINLDRTRAGRMRSEKLARSTTPGVIELAKMAARKAPPRTEKPTLTPAGPGAAARSSRP
jgi:hypothetical protein